MKRNIIAVAFLIATAFPCFAQEAAKPLVWVDPQNPYASYLESAVLKKHTPVQFTTDKSKAAYVLTLFTHSKKGSAARAIFLGAANSGAQSDISITVFAAKSGNVVFSYTCQKNGEFGRMQSAAQCLAKHWTHFIQKGKP